MDGRMDGRMDGWTDGWMDRLTDRQMDGQMDGQVDGHMSICTCIPTDRWADRQDKLVKRWDPFSVHNYFHSFIGFQMSFHR